MTELRIDIGHTCLRPDDAGRLRNGSVMSLDQSVGDPVTIFANKQRIGRGEVVVLGDKLGVRVTELTNPCEATPVADTAAPTVRHGKRQSATGVASYKG